MRLHRLFLLFFSAFLLSCDAPGPDAVKASVIKQPADTLEFAFDYHPVDSLLHADICRMDSLFFTAYNACDLETQASMIADDLEFYHDLGGLETSKSVIMEAIEHNICGKVSRELVPGSIEVYPIPGYGAVEIGMHRFFNREEPAAPSHPSRFVTVWLTEADEWKMSRVISLH